MTDTDSLSRQIAAELDTLDARTSLYAEHLDSGRVVAVRETTPMDTLSVIKIPIMILAFRDVESGRLDLDERHTIVQDEIRNGTGILKLFAPGLQPTFRDIVTQMIITSDNTATDIVIERIGLERVNEFLFKCGYPATRLQRTVGSYFRRRWELVDPENAKLSNWEVFERGFPRDEGAPERDFEFEGRELEWLGTSTTQEMARLFTQIYRYEIASQDNCKEMEQILRGQRSNTRLPRSISERAEVGHKTGDWGPLAGNDAGIIYADGGTIVVALFAMQNRGDFAELEATHGRIAELLFHAWI